MTTSQRYVSSELTHFVGRRHRINRSRQYQTLAYILGDGLLRSGALQADSSEIRTRPSKTLSSNNAIEPSTVCFCDIPEADFGIHMKKYGVFGISFAKSFLIEKGASPIFYIAANSKVAVGLAHLSRH